MTAQLSVLLEGMRAASEELNKSTESARAYLLSTGFYTKNLKLKKKFQ